MITIIIPAYNRYEDLRAALFSLEAQTDKEFRVLVSDDCSSQDLTRIWSETKFSFFIDYIRTPQNCGCGANRKFALTYFYEHPTDYLMFMDSDDRMAPQAVHRLNLAITHDQADLILSNIIQETEGPEQTIIPAEKSKTWLHGKIYRTEFLKQHGIMFPSDLKTNEDLTFNLSIYAYNPESYCLEENLYFWRQVETSVTHQSSTLRQCQSIDYLDGIYKAFLHYKDKPLANIMINSIIKCYEYWQRAVIYGTLQPYSERRMSKMLHAEDVKERIVKISAMPQDFGLQAWCMNNEKLVFFGQTFGQWLQKFFTPQEFSEMTEKYGNKKENLD